MLHIPKALSDTVKSGSSLGAPEKIFKYAWKLNYIVFGVQYNRASCLLTLFTYLRVHKCLVYLFC